MRSALGGLAGVFILPPALGFNGAYLMAIDIDVGVGVAAILPALCGGVSAAPAIPVAETSPDTHSRWQEGL